MSVEGGSARLPAPRRSNRQRQRIRNALLAAGQRLFAVQPADSVTIDNITEVADVAKGSFYNHFLDKEAFAGVIFASVQADLESEIASANFGVDDPPTRIARALCLVLRYAQSHPERLSALINLSDRRTAAAPLNAGVSGDITEGLRRGRIHGVSVETGVLVVLSLAMGTVRLAMADDCDVPAVELARSIASAILRALGLDHSEADRIGQEAVRNILMPKNAP
jgi:AcrR family transcriptional regulator